VLPDASAKPRLLVFEGIMGSGKSTFTQAFAQRSTAAGVPVAAFTEAADPHPVRASDDLPDFFQPWLHATASQLAERAREKWARYVELRLADDAFTVMDGQLFHGDLTHLFMMEMPPVDIALHCRALMDVLTPLSPLVVYLRQEDLPAAIHAVCAARGGKWVTYQLGWKLKSPYAVRRGLAGIEGLIELYQDYRALTDALFAQISCRKLVIDTAAGTWPRYVRQIEQELASDKV
jgi:hypothetical protein